MPTSCLAIVTVQTRRLGGNWGPLLNVANFFFYEIAHCRNRRKILHVETRSRFLLWLSTVPSVVFFIVCASRDSFGNGKTGIAFGIFVLAGGRSREPLYLLYDFAWDCVGRYCRYHRHRVRDPLWLMDFSSVKARGGGGCDTSSVSGRARINSGA